MNERRTEKYKKRDTEIQRGIETDGYERRTER